MPPLQHGPAAVPTDAESLDFGLRPLKTQGGDGTGHRVADELGQRNAEARDGCSRLSRFKPGRKRLDCALAIAEPNFGGVLADGFDLADAVLWVTDFHADVQFFDLHSLIAAPD